LSLPSSARRAAFVTALVSAGLLAAYAATAPGPVSAATKTGDCTPSSSWPAANSSLASQVMSLINQHRASIGEGQLVTSPTLTASAVWKARHMAAFDYFSHDDPGPPTATTPARTAADRIATCGYNASWGENIAEGFPDAQSVVTAWLNSPGHKANIENGAFVATGIGVATGTVNGLAAVYWVQDFGVVADSGSPPPPTTTAPPTTTTTPPATTTAPTTTTTATTTTAPATTTRTSTTTPATTTTGPSATTTTTAQGARVSLRLAPIRADVGSRRLALTTQVHSSTAITTSPVSVKCAARVGRRSLRVVVNVYRTGFAHCSWRVPANLQAGAQAHGWVKVTQGSLHVRRPFTFKLS
jgi:uncharacterized protein YkwD